MSVLGAELESCIQQ